MKPIPAIIAALPREVAALVRGTAPDAQLKRIGVYLYRLPTALVVCGGMGTVRVTLAVKAALDASPLTTLISAGLAGGCDPGVPVGSVVESRTIVDAQSGVRFTAVSGTATLVTTHSIASVKEKQRLFASYGASVVDMEACTVARLAEINQLSFRAIKAVSDAHDFELSSLSRFASPRGHFRTGAFALHTALRPHRWGDAVKLSSGSQRALRALTVSLEETLTS